jgi:hypothetical protein
LLSVTAFSTGFELTSAVRTREQIEALHEAFVMHRRPQKSAELDPGFSALGLSSLMAVRRRISGIPGM